MSFAQNDIWRFAPLGFAGYWVHPSFLQHNIGWLSFYSPLTSSESEFCWLIPFSTGYSPWFLGTMVHIERFILPYPNLISIEGLGTLPEHCLRSLGKLLGQLPIFRRDCSSPWQLECVTSRNAQSFYLRRLIVHWGALSSSSPPRTHDVSVVDTSLIY